MKRIIIQITVVLLLVIAVAACNKEVISIDENIPMISTTSSTMTETEETTITSAGTVTSSVVAKPSTTTRPRETEFDPGNIPYEMALQNMIDKLYVLKDDIAIVQKNGDDSENTRELAKMIEDAIGGRELDQKPRGSGLSGNATELKTYSMELDISQMAQKYPELTAQEPAIIRLLHWLCAEAQKNGSSTRGIYSNPSLYEILFPQADEITVTDDGNGGYLVAYDGYTGPICILKSSQASYRYDPDNLDMSIVEQPASIHDYVGTIQVAPANRFGAIGTMKAVKLGQEQTAIALSCHGDGIYVGPIGDRGHYEVTSTKHEAQDNIDHVIRALKAHPEVTQIMIFNCKMSSLEDLAPYISTDKVTSLSIGKSGLTGRVDLRAYTALTTLSLGGQQGVTDIVLSETGKLDYISLSNLSLDSLDFLKVLNKISSLSLSNTGVTSLDALAGQHIRMLTFTPSELDFRALSEIKGLQSLRVRGSEADWGDAINAELQGMVHVDVRYS